MIGGDIISVRPDNNQYRDRGLKMAPDAMMCQVIDCRQQTDITHNNKPRMYLRSRSEVSPRYPRQPAVSWHVRHCHCQPDRRHGDCPDRHGDQPSAGGGADPARRATVRVDLARASRREARQARRMGDKTGGPRQIGSGEGRELKIRRLLSGSANCKRKFIRHLKAG